MTKTVSHDDAPPATSKRLDGAEAAAIEGLPDRGDAITARAVTINRPAAELYAYWRDFANLATFMDNIVEISAVDATTSHWVVKAPGGKTVEWDATRHRGSAGRSDRLGIGRRRRRAQQRAASNSAMPARAAPSSPRRSSTIRRRGIVGKLIAKMFQREPAIQARRDLRRFKQLMETGEIATASRTARATRGGTRTDARTRPGTASTTSASTPSTIPKSSTRATASSR